MFTFKEIVSFVNDFFKNDFVFIYFIELLIAAIKKCNFIRFLKNKRFFLRLSLYRFINNVTKRYFFYLCIFILKKLLKHIKKSTFTIY